MPQIGLEPSEFICCIEAIKWQGVVVTEDGLLWISGPFFALRNTGRHSRQGGILQVLINSSRMLLLTFLWTSFINWRFQLWAERIKGRRQTGDDEVCQGKEFSNFCSRRRNAVLWIRSLDFNAGTLAWSKAGHFLQSVKHYHLESRKQGKVVKLQ